MTASLSKGTWGHGENADRLNVDECWACAFGKAGFRLCFYRSSHRQTRAQAPVATVCRAVCGAFRHFTETRGPRLAPSPCNCTNFYSLECWEQGCKAFRCSKTHQGLTEATKDLKLVRWLAGSRQPIESGRCRIGVACRGAETSHEGPVQFFESRWRRGGITNSNLFGWVAL